MRWVLSTVVVDRGLPFTFTTEPLTKPMPATVTVVAAEPTVVVAGLSASPVGMPLLTGIEAVADVPPPGAGFTILRERLPAAATSAAVRETMTCVGLTYVVAREPPPIWALLVGTKPVPAIVTELESPAEREVGLNDATAGAGLSISIVSGVPVALVVEPFKTATGNVAAEESSAAGIVAVNCVVLT